MPDTSRVLADVLELYADNTAGDISPQDGRDAIVSLAPAVGLVSVATPAATTIVTPGVFALGAGTGALSASARGVDRPSGLRARYTDTPARLALVSVCVALTVPAASRELGVRLYVDGAPVGYVIRGTAPATPGDRLTLAGSVLVSVAQNSYIEPYVTNYDGSESVTIEDMALSILGVIA